MIHGSKSHAPRKTSSMDKEDLVAVLRKKRNQAQCKANKSTDAEERKKAFNTVQQYNIMIEEFGFEPYPHKKMKGVPGFKRTCQKCGEEKLIEEFPIVVSYYRIKSGELREHSARRHTCDTCYKKQVVKAKKSNNKEFNYLF